MVERPQELFHVEEFWKFKMRVGLVRDAERILRVAVTCWSLNASKDLNHVRPYSFLNNPATPPLRRDPLNSHVEDLELSCRFFMLRELKKIEVSN
jgi:hypothetical protein